MSTRTHDLTHDLGVLRTAADRIEDEDLADHVHGILDSLADSVFSVAAEIEELEDECRDSLAEISDLQRQMEDIEADDRHERTADGLIDLCAWLYRSAVGTYGATFQVEHGPHYESWQMIMNRYPSIKREAWAERKRRRGASAA